MYEFLFPKDLNLQRTSVVFYIENIQYFSGSDCVTLHCTFEIIHKTTIWILLFYFI